MVQAERKYRWVGVYKIVRGDFVIVAGTGNEPPTYPRFPTTQGLCGVAAETRATLIVGDVRKDARWLPAFFTTKSEIVVPITSESNGRVLGMIDVESEKLNAFTEDDRDFLEHVAVLMARMLSRIERVLSEWLASGARGIGQVLIVKTDTGFALCHREDEGGVALEIFR